MARAVLRSTSEFKPGPWLDNETVGQRRLRLNRPRPTACSSALDRPRGLGVRIGTVRQAEAGQATGSTSPNCVGGGDRDRTSASRDKVPPVVPAAAVRVALLASTSKANRPSTGSSVSHDLTVPGPASQPWTWLGAGSRRQRWGEVGRCGGTAGSSLLSVARLC